MPAYDVFISHAREDKEDFVRPLAKRLRDKGLKVWYDEYTLTVGDSLNQKINEGLAASRFGIIVISPNFLEKKWPKKELDGLVAREVDGKLILPVWHNITADEIGHFSPILADRLAVSSKEGLDQVVDALLRAIKGASSSSANGGVPGSSESSPREYVPASFSIYHPVVVTDLLFITVLAILAFANPFSDPFLSYYIAAAVISLTLTLIILESEMSEYLRTSCILSIFLLMGSVAFLIVLWRYLDMRSYCAGHGSEPFGLQSRGNYLHYLFIIAEWFTLMLLSILKLRPYENNLLKWMVILLIWMISCRILWYVVEICEWIY